MREGKFIKQNIDKWKQYQGEPADDPDELAKRFTNLVDDLSYARTFYGKSNTARYINSIAAGIYLSIYKNKKEQSNRLITFWTRELPVIMYRQRRLLLFSFLFFLTFVMLGVLSAAIDPTFINYVLTPEYVARTKEHIRAGDPFGVYKGSSSFSMFLSIAYNNILVSFLCFAKGIFLTVGTLYDLFRNGLMVGAFEYFFFSNGLGAKSILVVFTHGTLELSAIVIAGCAGILLGNSILFPGTYTRLQSLRNAARDAIKIIIGLIPVFIIAAFFEGFVTRHTEMPLLLNIGILAGSATFIIYYFVVYPRLLSRKLKREKD